MKDLIVVIPVYNEEDSIKYVINEWYKIISEIVDNFLFLVINDGSTDSTREVLDKIKSKNSSIKVINKDNEGHGQSCIFGYEKAINIGTKWIFQIDSDGQCDPKYFNQLWEVKNDNNAVFGTRVKREDGKIRSFITFIEKIVVFIATGIWVKDPNVPYRLFKPKLVENILDDFPDDFDLANILLSVIIYRKTKKIGHIDIGFRKRIGGEPSVNYGGFFNKGIDLFTSLLNNKTYIKN